MSQSSAELLRQVKSQIDEVDPAEVNELIDEGVAVIDVRETDEVAAGHLPGAKHIPRGYLESRIEGVVPDRDAHVILYCASGNRSAYAARTLEGGPRLHERVVDDRRDHAVEGPRLRGPGARARSRKSSASATRATR